MMLATKMTLEEKLHLHYGISVQDISWFDSLYLKRVAARVTTPTKTYKLKRFRGTESVLKNLHMRHAVVQKLGLPHFPKWHTTKHRLVSFRDGHQRYYLTDWVDGRAFSATEPETYALGHVLHMLHVVPERTRGFRRPDFQQRARMLKSALARLHHLKDLNLPEDVMTFLASEKHAIQKTLRHGIRDLEKLGPGLKKSICHGDVTVPNILFPDQRAALIDWELVNVGFAMDELAKAVMNTCNLSPAAAHALLKGYQFEQLHEIDQRAFRMFLSTPREVIHLLKKGERGKLAKADVAQWQLVMDTWADRKRLFDALS